MIEAMYFYTPVIVSPYEDFTEEFGSSIDFGIYTGRDSLEGDLQRMLTAGDAEYQALCQNAHERVKNHTWEHFAECFESAVQGGGV